MKRKNFFQFAELKSVNMAMIFRYRRANLRLYPLSKLVRISSSPTAGNFQSGFSSSAPDRISSLLKNVGFIGLGNMGSRMAVNLINAGYQLTVHDINSEVMKRFSDMGVSTRKVPSEVAETCDVVITMLPSSSHVLDVYSGLINDEKLLRPWLFIDSSTIDPQTSKNLSATVSGCKLKEQKDNWKNPIKLDAPVSGSVIAAEAGTLTFMVGGSEEAYQAAKSLFLSMGRSAVYCGEAGSGSAAKICNNLALAVSTLGISEALALGQSLGVAPRTLTKIFNCSSARCWSSDTYNPVPGVMEGVPSSRNYEWGFASKLMMKDLSLAVASAEDAGLRHPLTLEAQQIYEEVCTRGHENKDFSCVFRHYYDGKDDSHIK